MSEKSSEEDRQGDPRDGAQSSMTGGARGDDGFHSPQCRKIFSISAPCGGSINATTFITPPHFGQASGSTSYTRLMSMAQVWLQRLGVGTGAAAKGTVPFLLTQKLGQSPAAAFRRGKKGTRTDYG